MHAAPLSKCYYSIELEAIYELVFPTLATWLVLIFVVHRDAANSVSLAVPVLGVDVHVVAQEHLDHVGRSVLGGAVEGRVASLDRLGVDVGLGVDQDLHALVMCFERREVERGRAVRWVSGVDLGALGWFGECGSVEWFDRVSG